MSGKKLEDDVIVTVVNPALPGPRGRFWIEIMADGKLDFRIGPYNTAAERDRESVKVLASLRAVPGAHPVATQ